MGSGAEMKQNRLAKVNELIQQRLAARLAEVHETGLITVTGVETAPDLRHATVWISTLGEFDEGELAEIIPELRAAMSGLEIKYVPRLEFKYDRGLAHAERIERILRGL